MQKKNELIENAPNIPTVIDIPAVIPTIIDNSDLLCCKYDDLPKSLDRIKRKTRTWKIAKKEEKKIKKKESKIYIDFGKNPPEKIFYSRDKKSRRITPNKIEKNEMVFFLNKNGKCPFNHVREWILPEKMRKGIKSIEIGCDYSDIIKIPEILFRNEPIGDNTTISRNIDTPFYYGFH